MHLDQVNDPDFYYHVAISKEYLMSGIPQTVPQATGIGWQVQFIDKEFFFHIITSLFYSLFGEAGLKAVPLISAFITFLALAFHSFKKLGKHIFWLPFLVIVIDPNFLFRLILVRPHVLGILFFVLIMLGFLWQKKYLIMGGAILFALSYHALQIPLLFSLIALFTREKYNKTQLHCVWACWIGILIGTLANPYFPGQLTIIQQIFFIVTKLNSKTSLNFGNEILPWSSEYVLRYNIIPFLIFASSFFLIGQKALSSKSQTNLKLLTFFSIICLALSLLTPRAREYFIPTLFLLSVELLSHRSQLYWKKFWPIIPITAILQFAAVASQYDMLVTNNVKEQFPIIQALEKIPKNNKKHLLNCSWGNGAYVYYSRPNLTFLDLLDPSFLFLHNPSLHQLRMNMLSDSIIDPAYSIQNTFKADYFLCESKSINLRLDRDPGFKRIYPPEPVGSTRNDWALFEILPDSGEFFVKNYLYSIANHPSQAEQPLVSNTNYAAPDYIDVYSLLPKNNFFEVKNDVLTTHCLNLKPTQDELQKMIGSTFLGLGGGPITRMWLNEKEYFSLHLPAGTTLQKINTLIPLPEPFKKTDQIRLQVCPSPLVSHMGIALSYWNAEQIQNLCRKKGFLQTLSFDKNFAFTDTNRTCLGPIANRKLAWKN